MIRPVALASVVGALVVASVAAPLGYGHVLRRPPPPVAHSLTVDEQEWSIIGSQRVVAAGAVTLHVYNRGMDPHNVTLSGPGGRRRLVVLASGAAGTVLAHLRRGTYTLFCSMYAGTPQSHEALGMRTVLKVH